nr:SDR family oxidoreductase [Acinetobacter sp. Marseille-Q1620]
MRLQDKTIFITGATSGIGLASLKKCIEQGAFVVFTARHATSVQEIQQRYPKQTLGLVHDSANISAQKTLIQTLQEQNINLDAVFLNAGNVSHAHLEEWDEQSFDLLINTNLKGPFFFIQAALPILNQGCSVILCGSTSIHIALEQSSVYAASKIALRSLVKTLSRELLSKNIRFNLLSPGPTFTPALDKIATTDVEKAQLKQQIKALVPIGRFAEASEIANALIYLASDESRFVVGTELLVDGGVANL